MFIKQSKLNNASDNVILNNGKQMHTKNKLNQHTK